MNFLAADVIERFYTFMWPMLRISALMITAPIFSLSAFNTRMRILVALVLAWLVYPLYTWPVIDPTSAQGLVEVFNQIMIGATMGLILQIVVAAVVVAGQSIAAAMGLSMANMIDPNMGNVPVISQLLIVMSTLIFVGFGGHAMRSRFACLMHSALALPWWAWHGAPFASMDPTSSNAAIRNPQAAIERLMMPSPHLLKRTATTAARPAGR